MTAQSSKTRRRETLLIVLAWLLYTICYLGKVNYSANITQIIDYYGVTKDQAGMAPSFFFFAYGVGQVINGLFCKRYNIKWMVFGGMALSAAVNLVVPLLPREQFDLIKWLWMVNGIALSVLWPTLIRMLAEALPRRALSRSSIYMGTTVGLGTLIIYGLSAVFAVFDNFKLAFYTAAFAGTAVAVLWLCSYNKAIGLAKAEREASDEPAAVPVEAKGAPGHLDAAEHRLIHTTIAVLCFMAIGINLIKDGLTTWVPSIMKESYGFDDSLSILLTLTLPITAIFGNLLALWMHKKVPDYVNHCGIVMLAMGVLLVGLIASLDISWVLLLAGMIVVGYLAASLNSLNTSIFPMFMRDKVNSGLMAGLLNGFCYVGSTISSYGLGAVAERFNSWTAVFWVLFGFCAVAMAAWALYAVAVKFIKRHN